MLHLAAVVLAALLGLLQPPQAPPPSAGPGHGTALELSLLSFNVRYDNPADGPDRWPNRRDQVIALVKAHRPDALGLQEVLKAQLDERATRMSEAEARLLEFRRGAQVEILRDDASAVNAFDLCTSKNSFRGFI